MELGQEI